MCQDLPLRWLDFLFGMCGVKTETFAVVLNFTFFTGKSNSSETFCTVLLYKLFMLFLLFQNFQESGSGFHRRNHQHLQFLSTRFRLRPASWLRLHVRSGASPLPHLQRFPQYLIGGVCLYFFLNRPLESVKFKHDSLKILTWKFARWQRANCFFHYWGMDFVMTWLFSIFAQNMVFLR